MVVITKILAAVALLAVVTRLLVRRDSELARRFRIFVDISLLLILGVYGVQLLQQWL